MHFATETSGLNRESGLTFEWGLPLYIGHSTTLFCTCNPTKTWRMGCPVGDPFRGLLPWFFFVMLQ